MRVYVNSAVSLDNLRLQVAKPIFDANPDSGEQIFRTLVNIDPTADYTADKGGKYVPWIIRQYNKGNLSEEQYTNLQDALRHFNQRPKYYEHTDLGQYKTVKDFLNDAESVSNRPLTEKEKAKQAMKAAHRASDADKEFIAQDGVWELWTPKTHAGSMSLARWGGTQARWCTAAEKDYYWNHYTTGRNGETPLYIFINTSNPAEKYQLHQNSHSWYDINDNSLRMSAFYKFLSDKPVFSDFFGFKIIDGYTLINNQIIEFPSDTTDYVIPDEADSISAELGFPTNATSFVLPDHWTQYEGPVPGDYWRGGRNLTYIHFPENLTVIRSSFCSRCSKLTTVDFPSNLEQIRSSAFVGCSSLSEIALPDSVVSIGEDAFGNCTALTTFKLPASMTVLKHGVVSNHNWEDLDLNAITTLRSYALADTNIKVLRNLKNVTKFGAEAFAKCSCPTLLATDLNPNASFGHNAFRDCTDLSGTFTINENTKLGIDSFTGCKDLEIMWAAPDASYEFDGIKLLICSNTCTELIAANKGYVPIDTIEGEHYDAEI